MIAVIAAMDAEVEAITSIMQKVETFEKSGIAFYKGSLENRDIMIMKSGVGKGNATMSTTILLENFAVDCVVNIGTAGGLLKEENILDAVVSEAVVQHDFDTSPIDGDAGIGLYFQADDAMIHTCVEALASMDVITHKGLIASGDQFIANDEQLALLQKRFPKAICAEMEAGAIAQVCNHYHIPFVVLRSLSDVALRKDSHMDFNVYVKEAAKRSAAFMKAFIQLSKDV